MRKDKIHEKTALDRHDEKIAHEFTSLETTLFSPAHPRSCIAEKSIYHFFKTK